MTVSTSSLLLGLSLSVTLISLSSCTQESALRDDARKRSHVEHSKTEHSTSDSIGRAALRSSDPSTPVSTSTPMNLAKALFHKRCSRCHGERGDGAGAFASQLNPRPTDLTSHAWYQHTNQKKIKRVIIGGGRAIGKSPMMPSHADLRNKPKLLNALVLYITQLAPRAH